MLIFFKKFWKKLFGPTEWEECLSDLPRPLTYVKVRDKDIDYSPYCDIVKYTKEHPYTIIMYIGEVQNNSGHGLFINVTNNEIYAGAHIDEFEEMTDDDLDVYHMTGKSIYDI